MTMEGATQRRDGRDVYEVDEQHNVRNVNDEFNATDASVSTVEDDAHVLSPGAEDLPNHGAPELAGRT